MKVQRHTAMLCLGGLSIATGALFNKWVIEAAFVSDHHIANSTMLAGIAVVQIVLVALGAYLVIRRHSIRLSVKVPGRGEAVLLLASIVTPLLVIEAVLRVLDYNPFGELANGRELILRPSSVKERIYEATPFAEGYAWGTHVRINSRGFRDREYELQKPAGTSRVVVVGDSVAFGNSLGPNESFARRLDDMVRQKGRAVEVLNMALGGYDTLQEVATLKDIGIQYQPDVVVVGYVVNDVEVASTNVEYILRARRYGSPIYRIRLFQFVRSRLDTAGLGRDNMRANLEANFAADNRDYIADTTSDAELGAIMSRLKTEMETNGSAASRFRVANYLSHARIGKLRYALGELGRLQRQHGFRVLVVIVPYLVEEKRYESTYRLIYDIVEHESTRAGFEVIRLEGSFEAAGYDQLIIAGWDRLHPNALGHTLIAKALYDQLYDHDR